MGKDHPRVCGEKKGCPSAFCPLEGSPPRVRGKVRLQDIARALEGITPACAGKSEEPTSSLTAPWDHPRVCGEKLATKATQRCTMGSPPRVRGKVHEAGAVKADVGITPACAGKRFLTVGVDTSPEDHPRVCGEKCILYIPQIKNIGSPPRVRGKAVSLLCGSRFVWITPACAGKSYQHRGRRCPQPGSPPRVRGKVWQFLPQCVFCRITPACAGKRYLRYGRRGCYWDHPRVCGEK